MSEIEMTKIKVAPRSVSARSSRYQEIVQPVLLAMAEMEPGEHMKLVFPNVENLTEEADLLAYTRKIKGILYDRARTSIALSEGESFKWRIVDAMTVVVSLVGA